MKEVWKPVEGCAGRYDISNKGRVRSWIKSGPKGSFRTMPLILKLSLNTRGGGYFFVILLKRKAQTHHLYIHRAVYHHFVKRITTEDHLDHIDGNSRNNKLSNLRIATRSQNTGNSKKKRDTVSKYKGVNWCKRTSRWKASIKKLGRSVSIGLYRYEKDAARAYNKEAKDFFGEYARLNKI